MGLGIYTRRYIRSVADFLSAGRVCGRYVISVGDVANAISIIGLVAYVEIHYKTGFALAFWNNLILPIGLVLSLTGYCTYRFRETKAMSLGQFLELRYSRRFRIFASALRSITEMLANMIMPAIAARFFIAFLGLPYYTSLFGYTIPTFIVVLVFITSLGITMICMGGTLTLLVTDAVQGMICYPLMVAFIIFILCKFSWSEEIMPVMMDRVAGESFINPYDIYQLRDFNVFSLVVVITATIMHRASWIGAGYSTAAKSPHEQKMAGLLGTWRNAMVMTLYVLIAVAILTLLNHKNFSSDAKEVRTALAARTAEQVVEDSELRSKLTERLAAIPAHQHTVNVDPPLSQEQNLDTPYLDIAHQTLLEGEAQESKAHEKFQEFRTLFHQLSMAFSMREMLPTGLLGLFGLLMIMAMISTDDTRIFSASLTITQDVILPLKKKPLSPKQHIWVIRFVSIGVGIFFIIGSFFMSQLDYIQLFVTIICSLWMGGCGPLMILGLYSRFGTTAGAWASLLSGMFISVFSILIQRNWAGIVYPWLNNMGWIESIDKFLQAVSGPFNPYIVWTMNPVKFPINSYEIYLATMMFTLTIYIVVSKLTMKEPFNLDRMLHRGKYNLDHENKEQIRWSAKTALTKIIGITPDYTKGDKIIAWGVFFYSFGYAFCGMFLAIVIWNSFSPWPLEWWGHYFFVVFLLVPLVIAFITTIWFGIGGVIDLFRLFRDLNNRQINDLDNGSVVGHVSLADKAQVEEIEKDAST